MDVTEFEHESILRRDDLKRYVWYVEDLVKNAEDPDADEEDRQENQELLDDIDLDIVDQIRDMLNDTEDESFVSEDYWAEYQKDQANETYGLDKTGAEEYFDYERYADDRQAEWYGYTIDGTTYYAQY